MNKISTRLLGLEFKSDKIIKSKAMKFFDEKYALLIRNNGNLLCKL